MDTLLLWATQYSLPVLLLLAFGAALLYLGKLISERLINLRTAQIAHDIELRQQRRSAFEQQVLTERYRIVCDMVQRLARISTELNRAGHGRKVAGLFEQGEVVPLTAVYEELAARRIQLTEGLHGALVEMAHSVMLIAQAPGEAEREAAMQDYVERLEALRQQVNQEFGSEQIRW
jgi:hypothetical protein